MECVDHIMTLISFDRFQIVECKCTRPVGSGKDPEGWSVRFGLVQDHHRITIQHSDKSILLHFLRCPGWAALRHSDKSILLHFLGCPAWAILEYTAKSIHLIWSAALFRRFCFSYLSHSK